MRKAIKFGFGCALGVYLFGLCASVADKVTERYFVKRFNEDKAFRTRVKNMSPELYVKYRKNNGNVNNKDFKTDTN